jgi:acetyl esterase/lipase
VIGSKDQQGLPLVNHLASHGWVCLNANYRLSPHATFPEHLVDVKRAIAWYREHAREYGADPDFLVLAGGSAGGHLAALAALTPGDPEYQPGFESADTTVQGCVPYYAVYDFTDRFGVWPHRGLRAFLARHVMKASFEEAPERFDRASPMSRIGSDAPPFFVIHGDRDTLVPVEEARYFAEKLAEVSRAPVAFAEIPGAQHAFEIFHSLRSQLVTRGVERFLTAIRARALEARAGRRVAAS